MTDAEHDLPPASGHALIGEARVVAIVGNYGSGKTEAAVNLALSLAAAGAAVQIADLDLVNPYFRCREAAHLMRDAGIRVVVPPGAQAFADLPIVVPEVRALWTPPPGTVSLFDVGGDDVGARALASFRTSVAEGGYELWQVINARRPFTDSVDGCLAMRDALERGSRFRVTGLLVNTHLMEHTTAATVLDGWRLARAVSAASGLPVRLVAVMAALADDPALAAIDVPVLRMHRHMRPPWLGRAADMPLPAARPVPLGRARPVQGVPL